MSDPVRIGLIGCGRLAELGYVPAATASAAVEIAAVADPDPARRAVVAAALGGRAAFASYDELLGTMDLDAVVVASPPAHHEAAAGAAAAAGLPVLVEKPAAPDAAGAARIAALEPMPWIGFNRRFSLGRGITGLAAGGSIDAEIRYRRFSWAPVSVRDPALIDLAPHLIDLALVAGVGPVEAVSASSSRPERVVVELRGKRGTARIRCACDLPHRERLVIRDVAGSVILTRQIGGPIRGVVARIRPGGHPLVASLASQLDAFAAAARDRRPAADATLATAVDGLRAMRVVDVAAASLVRGGAPVAAESVECGAL